MSYEPFGPELTVEGLCPEGSHEMPHPKCDTENSMARNIGFILKNAPLAHKKADAHFNKAIETAGKIGAKGILAQAYLDLGRLHKAKKRIDAARECILYQESVEIIVNSGK